MSAPFVATTTDVVEPERPPEKTRMRAMWLVEPGKFELRYQSIYDVTPNWVLLRIAYCGICPWDLRVYAGKKQVPLPRVMGHEAGGTVVSVGDGVTHLQVGQRVVGDFIVKCGVCRNCRAGRANRCLNPRFPNGAYEDFAVLPEQNLHIIQRPTTALQAAAFMEPLAWFIAGIAVCAALIARNQIMAARGIRMAHLPLSNCEVGAGIAPVPELIEAGVTVGPGSDGYVNDMYEVVRGAFLIHKAYRQDPRVLPAAEVWYLATEGGARALGLEHVGQVAEGWQADLQLIDTRFPTPVEEFNLYDQLVLWRDHTHVRAVWVAGQLRVRDGAILGADEDATRARAHAAARRLWAME